MLPLSLTLCDSQQKGGEKHEATKPTKNKETEKSIPWNFS
jgi:hypothetical protein